MDDRELECAIESILFVSGEPVKVSRIASVLDSDETGVLAAADRLRDFYSFERRGIRLVKLEETLQLVSSPEYADHIRRTLETRKPPQLSPPALEVLAIVAYFGPVTKLYVEQIRGVDSAYTMGLLAERELIEPCGRLNAPGRPILYKTTHNFLRVFGLESLGQLPELPHIEGSENEKEGIQSAILQLKVREAEMGTEDKQAKSPVENPAKESAEDSVAEDPAEIAPEDSSGTDE